MASKAIDVSQYVLYLREQQTLVCRACEYCLQPNGIENHLRRKHSAIPLEVRKKLVSYAKGLMLRNPSEVVTPVAVVSAFDCLKITQGFRCLTCDSLYGTAGSINEHCKVNKWPKPEGTHLHQII